VSVREAISDYGVRPERLGRGLDRLLAAGGAMALSSLNVAVAWQQAIADGMGVAEHLASEAPCWRLTSRQRGLWPTARLRGRLRRRHRSTPGAPRFQPPGMVLACKKIRRTPYISLTKRFLWGILLISSSYSNY
jgi:hypothetical protein